MGKGNVPHVMTPDQIELFGHLPHWTAFVDPGPTCGMVLLRHPPRPQRGDNYERFYFSYTMPQEQAQSDFARFCLEARRQHKIPNLVIEEYRIYPGSIGAHYGKTIPTAECIGAFKWIVGRMGGSVTEHASDVKQTTHGMLRARGIKVTTSSEHAKDAELHMWHFVLKQMYEGRKIG